MTQLLADYFDALERLKTNRPTQVPKGTKITNDAVSLEAGRGKGSIKKSRPVFAGLIEAIASAAEEQSQEANQYKNKLKKTKLSADQYRIELEAALAREVSLLYELYELKKKLVKITGEKILPIRSEKNSISAIGIKNN